LIETIASLVTSDGSVARTAVGSSVASAIVNLNVEPHQNTWVWLKFSNSNPEPGALAALLDAASRSELTAIIGPKLVSSANPRIITQLGLTLTPLGDAFSPVSEVFDQGQRDRPGDVLAVGAPGMLFRSSLLSEVGNFDENAPELAADIDFSIRTRMAGYRVAVEPAARVSYDGKAAELGRSLKVERRKASIHLRMVYSPIWLVALYWLALIPMGFLRATFRIAQKRPDRIWAELYGGFWGFFSAPARLRSRSNLPKQSEVTLASLKPLRASWGEVRLANRASADRDESQQNLAAFARGGEADSPAKGFGESFAWLFVILLAAASWKLFPVGVVTGGGALPLSPDLAHLFARAGASWQPIGDGFIAPSDPFNWVLLMLGSATFWAPQLSIGILLFVARSLAFVGAWRVAGLATKKAWVRNLAALAFALWPTFGVGLGAARVPEVVATICLPWLVLAITRAAGIGRFGSARSNRQTWSWVALAGLLLAIEGASAPSLLPLILLGLAVVALMRIRRLGYLFWIPLPLGAIFAPYAYTLIVGLGHPAAVLADSGVAASTKIFNNFELLVGGSVLTVVYLAVSLGALLTKRWVAALALWAFGLLLLAGAWLTQQLVFPGYETKTVTGSPLVLLSAVALIVTLLCAIALDSLSRRGLSRITAGLLVLGGFAPLGYFAATSPTYFSSTDGRVVPWLLVAQGDTDAQLLVISATRNNYAVQWLPARGAHLEDLSTVYRFDLQNRVNSSDYQALAQLAGNMVSANGLDISSALQKSNVEYILVPDDGTAKVVEIAASLNSVPQLESAGDTEFGKLWRVKAADKIGYTRHSVWSLTKGVQLAVIFSFLLLAIPSRSRKKSLDAEIFLGEEESDV